MGIFIGETEINDIKIGDTEINTVYIGATEVWQRSKTLTNDYHFNRITHSYDTHEDTIHAGFSASISELDQSSLAPNTNFTRSPLAAGQSGTPAITDLRWYSYGGEATNLDTAYVRLALDKEVSNGGWETMTIGNTTYDRSSAAFTAGSGTSTWTWSQTWNESGSTNPFGPTAGATRTITWT